MTRTVLRTAAGWRLAAVLLAALSLLPAAAVAQSLPARAWPCGADAPCAVEGGEYYLAVPDGWDGVGALPALVFFHGHRSSGAQVIATAALRAVLNGAGLLLIAPNGALSPGRDLRGWPARPDSGTRDDLAFTLRVLDDVAARLPLDRARLLVSGFSSGGSMAWYVACYAGERFAGFAPVAGALRRPLPAAGCPGGPVRLIHFHGFTDSVVPLEGRAIRNWHQGDVFESLELLRRNNGCRSNPSGFASDGRFQCRVWSGCAGDAELQFCLHPGGHGLPPGWTERALDWLAVPG